uniref:ParE toxin of type II toxin-antitoxin system, parDE n=1 Tax=Candidatus Kentrum sp. TC TaxID=2126339 RepID=A0A450YZ40_9GAMM|nr:MAG: hypothetical protein BECKTC1821E_GA0114239_100944 [Candidatus Kentron sp. TC]VFK46796.1 MAG: hypothetical protein BECKTC1821D_GA0114238_10367 [Candidatus Kentron sp. TC]
MVKFRIHDLAAREFDQAIQWYELQSKGLGKRFEKVVKQQLKNIKQNPSWFLVEQNNIHKAYVPRFPYKILFTMENEGIVIWAVAHLHRKPRYWQSRNIHYPV